MDANICWFVKSDEKKVVSTNAMDHRYPSHAGIEWSSSTPTILCTKIGAKIRNTLAMTQ